uniref:C2H2-type domain-containing protein n=1 Tax=Hippocampus comes TaxID=109280 RepID=A0A3Q2YY16_HIPCM
MSIYYPYGSDTQGNHSSAGIPSLLNSPLSQHSVKIHSAPGMAPSGAPPTILPFRFRQRRESVDWRRIHAVDIDLVISQLDVDVLQEHISTVTFCSLDGEQCQRCQSPVDRALIKILQLAQLTVEWLLHCQECLTLNLQAAEERLASTNMQQEQLLAQLKKQEESMTAMTAELKNRRKIIRKQQTLFAPQITNSQKCTFCKKKFLTTSFLQSHMQRRHPDENDIRKSHLNPMNTLVHVKTYACCHYRFCQSYNQTRCTVHLFCFVFFPPQHFKPVLRQAFTFQLQKELSRLQSTMLEHQEHSKRQLQEMRRKLQEKEQTIQDQREQVSAIVSATQTNESFKLVSAAKLLLVRTSSAFLSCVVLQMRPRSSSLPSRASRGTSEAFARQAKTPQPAPRVRISIQPKTSTPSRKRLCFCHRTPPFCSFVDSEDEDTDMEDTESPQHQRGKTSQARINKEEAVQISARKSNLIQTRPAPTVLDDEDELSDVSELQEIDSRQLQSFKDQNGNVEKTNFAKGKNKTELRQVLSVRPGTKCPADRYRSADRRLGTPGVKHK